MPLRSGRWSRWSIALTALLGAWLGHFVEYVRVSGWQAAIGSMTRPSHAYFFPIGAALMAVVAVVVLLARKTWTHLGARLRAAQIGLWTRPRSSSNADSAELAISAELPRRPTLPIIWMILFVLQTGTWVIQENLESVSAGKQAPLLTVMSGVHWLAPLIQAEVALILAVACWLARQRFNDRRSLVAKLERLVAQKWSPRYGFMPTGVDGGTVASTPLDRWGSQRWQRPPPTRLIPI